MNRHRLRNFLYCRCHFLYLRYLFSIYWWGVGAQWAWRRLLQIKEPPLVRDYVQLREGLKTAELKNGRIISSVPDEMSKPEEAVEWLYKLLTVLDTKASALMRLNGVMLAAAAFLLSADRSGSATASLIRVAPELTLSIAALSSVSIALCLLVVSVDWKFLGCVRKIKNSLDFTNEVINLERVSLFRQYVYRFSWLISLIATVLFVIAFISPISELIREY